MVSGFLCRWRDRRALQRAADGSIPSMDRLLDGYKRDRGMGLDHDTALDHAMGNWQTPVNYRRGLDGLPPLTPEEVAAARQAADKIIRSDETTAGGWAGSWKTRRMTKTSKDAARDYSCVMVNVTDPNFVKEFKAVVSAIADEDIYDPPEDEKYGREDRPHVTVKYGLHTDDADDARPLIEGFGPIEFQVSGVSFFRGDDKEYDVLKLDIESDDLNRLREKIEAALESTDEHPIYQPHMTLAYLKRDTAEHWVEAVGNEFKGKTFTVDSVCFSNKGSEKTEIDCAKAATASWRSRWAKKKKKRNPAYEKETEKINENKKLPEASKPHDFNAAEWTHPNGHPRCLKCGGEEIIGGRCNVEPTEKDYADFQAELDEEFALGQVTITDMALRLAGYKDWSASFLFDPRENPVPFPKPGQRSGLWGWVYANDEAAKEHGTDDLDELAFLVDNTFELNEAAHREIKDQRLKEGGMNALMPVKDNPEVINFLKRHFEEINREYVYPTWGKQKPEKGHENDPFYQSGGQWRGQAKDVIGYIKAIYGEEAGGEQLEKFLSRLKPGEREDFLEEAEKPAPGMGEWLQEAIEHATGKTEELKKQRPSPKTEMTEHDIHDIPTISPDDVAAKRDALLEQYSQGEITQQQMEAEMAKLDRMAATNGRGRMALAADSDFAGGLPIPKNVVFLGSDMDLPADLTPEQEAKYKQLVARWGRKPEKEWHNPVLGIYFVTFNSKMKCPMCKGTGKSDGDAADAYTCVYCKGDGADPEGGISSDPYMTIGIDPDGSARS